MTVTYKIKLEKYVKGELADRQGYTLIIPKPHKHQKPRSFKTRLTAIAQWIVDALLSDVGGDLRDGSYIIRDLDDRYEVDHHEP